MSILESRNEPAESSIPLSPEPTPLAKAWAYFGLLSRLRFARKLGTAATHGYLAQTGWVRSVLRAAGTIETAAPLPWATFPYIAFIGPRLRPDLRVFEYGAGSSTLYYARHVRSVVAVEHDEGFARALIPHLPANATVILAAAHSEGYRRAIERDGGNFDLVVVDGRDRVRCVEAALAGFSPGGVLVLDDAEREEYTPAAATLVRSGFRRLDFWGLAPGVVGTKSTAVFYRSGNCLDL